LRFADPQAHALWHALLLLRLQPQGFRNADLSKHLAALSGRRVEEIGQGAMSYQLRRLRLHGMTESIPNSHRYRVTTMGLRAALFFTRSYTRVARSRLAFGLPGHRAVLWIKPEPADERMPAWALKEQGDPTQFRNLRRTGYS